MLRECYERAGLAQSDAAYVMAFSEAQRRLASVTDNQVLLLYRDQASEAAVMDYERATDRRRAFERLLSEPVTPAQLRGLARPLG